MLRCTLLNQSTSSLSSSYLITSVGLHPSPHLTPLDEEVRPGSDEISSIEAGLVLGGHELPLCSQFVPVLHRADGVVLRNTGEIGLLGSNKAGRKEPVSHVEAQ